MDRIRNLIVAALLASACASPFMALLSLPSFDGGVHPEAETVAVGIHALAALDAFLLLLLSVVDASRVVAAVGPACLGLLAVGAVGLLALDVSIYAPRSLWGSLDHCVGAIWYLEGAVLAVAYGVAWSSTARGRLAAGSAPALAILTCVLLRHLPWSWHGSPLRTQVTGGALGLYALLASVPLLGLERRWANLAAAGLAAVGLAASRDLATVASMVACVLAWTAVRRRTVVLRPLASYAVAASATLAVTASLMLAAPALVALATRSVDVAATPEVTSAAAVDHVAVQAKPYGALWRRSEGARFVLRDLLAVPSRLVAGEGFGSFRTAWETQVRSAPGRMPSVVGRSASLTAWSPRGFAGAPSLVAGLALSVGFVGLLAFLVQPATALARTFTGPALPGTLLSSILCVGLSLRDLPDSSLPVLVAALCAVPRAAFHPSARRTPVGPGETLKAAAFTVAAAAFVIGGFVAFALSFVALNGERAELALFPMPATPCAAYAALGRPSDDVNMAVLDKLLLTLRRTPDVDQGRLGYFLAYKLNFANYACMLREASGGDRRLKAFAALDERRSLLASVGYGDPDVPLSLKEDFESWPDDVAGALALALAPGRTDLVLPYLGWLARSGQGDEASAAAARLSSRVPQGDPVKEWLSSRLGFDAATLAKARKDGLDNLYDVP